jgi:hypothetical protein
MQVLAAAAIGALGKVLLIIAAHGWSDTGDVVTPTGENVAYNRINTTILAAVATRRDSVTFNFFSETLILRSHRR